MNLRLTPSVNLDLITRISPFPHDLIYSPYSPKVLVFSPNARPLFPNFNSLWVQASRRDLSVLAQAFHTRSYKISRLDVNDIIFYPITDCLLKRLQRIQFEAASFVFGRYVNNIDSILKLGWLPMKERREWHVLKAAHKAIYSHDWPRNLQLEQVRHARNWRSSSTINLVIPYASDTFQYSAAALFNSLPSNVKCCDNFKSFSKQTLCILRERCRNRAQ